MLPYLSIKQLSQDMKEHIFLNWQFGVLFFVVVVQFGLVTLAYINPSLTFNSNSEIQNCCHSWQMCANLKWIHVLWITAEKHKYIKNRECSSPHSIRLTEGHMNIQLYVFAQLLWVSPPPFQSWDFSFRSFCKQAPGDTQLHSPGDWPLRVPTCRQTQIASRQWISTLSWLQRPCTTLFYWHNEERREKGLKWENHFHADWIKRTKEFLAVAAFNL